MRIKFILPLPLHAVGIELRAAQIPRNILSQETEVDCIPVRNSASIVDSAYGMLLFDLYIVEAGIRAESEGYDAVVMDTASDSGLTELRSRLTIPVIGPGLVYYAVAMMLGKRFSILNMLESSRFWAEKTLRAYDMTTRCASIRSVGVEHDFVNLLTGKESVVFPKLLNTAERCIEEDGADLILLGSTSMHQAGEYLSERLPVPVLSPGPIALKMAETLVQLGLSHSKIAFPSPSTFDDDQKLFALVGPHDQPLTSASDDT